MDFTEYTIEECCDILNNLRFPLNAEQRFDMQGEYPYYGANGVQGYINQWRFDEDLILIAEDGGNFEQFDKRPIAYRVSGKCWVNNHAHVIKAKPNFSQSFIFYSLEHKNILFFIAGGTRSKLTQGELKKIAISHPNKLVADKIGIILEKADAAIAQTEALIAKYQRIKTGLMQDLLTKGIDEHGNIRSEQTHRFKTEKGLRVPEEWEVGAISEIASINPKTDISNLCAEDFVSFFKMEDVSNDAQLINKNERQLKDVLSGFTDFQDSDTLFAKITPCMENGKGGLVKALKNGIGFGSTEFHVLRPKNLKSELFIFYYSTFKPFRLKAEAQMTGSAGQQRVQRFFFEKHLIGIPPLDEQFNIGKRIEAISEYIRIETKNLSKLQSLKTGLMQDLLSGKVRVKIEN